MISLPDREGSPETYFFDLPEAFLFHSCYILVVPKQLFWIIPWEGRHQLLLNTSKDRWKGKVVEEEVLAADGRRWRLNEKKKKRGWEGKRNKKEYNWHKFSSSGTTLYSSTITARVSWPAFLISFTWFSCCSCRITEKTAICNLIFQSYGLHLTL